MDSQKWRFYYSFWRNLEATEFFFPTIVLVLSTLRITQFSHEIPYLSNFSSIQEKIHAAVAPSSPDVRHISRKWEVTVLERLMTKILTKTGFIFFHAYVIWPISSNWEKASLAMFYKVIAAMWCTWIIDDSPCFGTTWCIVPNDFTIRKYLLKQGIKVVKFSKWQIVLH